MESIANDLEHMDAIDSMETHGNMNCPELVSTGLDWAGLEWTGMDWVRLDWNGRDWDGLDRIELDWTGLDWIGVDWTGLDAGCMSLFIFRMTRKLLRAQLVLGDRI